MKSTVLLLRLLLAGIVGSVAGLGATRADELEHVFRTPPESAKPWVMWFWIGDFVSKEAITYDLEAYNRAGIGGLLVFPNYEHVEGWGFAFSIQGRSENRVQPLSDPWYDCVRHTIQEAHRLGMQLCFHNGPGYSGAGGPWIGVEHSPRVLVEHQTVVTGPGLFRKELARADGLDYRDVAVLACREVRLFKPGQKDRLPLQPEEMVDLTGRLAANGVLDWLVPEGRWRIIRYGHISSGKRIHPASPVAEGYESDKMNREAVWHHFEKGMIGRILSLAPELNGKTVVGIELDSYEGGDSDWTPGFREEFRRRRGYDLLPWLPAWRGKEVVGSAMRSEQFRYDMQRTIAELHADVYYDEAAAFCRRRGVRLYTEAYGTPLWDPLTNAGRADVPMAEFWVRGELLATVRMMAGAAHTLGKRVITAEAFTYRTERDPWWITPSDLKPLGDLAYCLGLNHTVLTEGSLQFWHDRVKPGMAFDAWGTPFSVNQTWWEPGRAWMEYQARCHALLQQGRFIADILVLSPFPAQGFDHWNGPVGIGPQYRNYNFDLCAEEVFLNRSEWLASQTPRPSKGRYAFTTYKHLQASDTLLPSGLLGPVRLIQEEQTRNP